MLRKEASGIGADDTSFQSSFTSALTGQRVPKIFDLVDAAAEQNQRRVSTSVINEVLEDALRWQSPPATRQGKQGRIYYGTQVQSKPPTITLFVNNPALFKENYRRYIERQFRQSLGFSGTPIRLIWRAGSPIVWHQFSASIFDAPNIGATLFFGY